MAAHHHHPSAAAAAANGGQQQSSFRLHRNNCHRNQQRHQQPASSLASLAAGAAEAEAEALLHHRSCCATGAAAIPRTRRSRCFLAIVVAAWALALRQHRHQREVLEGAAAAEMGANKGGALLVATTAGNNNNNGTTAAAAGGGGGGGSTTTTGRNFHSLFPAVCGERVDVARDVHRDTGAMYETMEELNGGGWAHMHVLQEAGTSIDVKVDKLVKLQSCMYASLERWNRLADERRISRWSAVAGTLIGSTCYKSMNPWDDDVDVMLSKSACDAVGRIHGTSKRAPSDLSFEDNGGWKYDTRLLDGDGKWLLSKFENRNEGLFWYKLKPLAQLDAAPTGDDTSGMDLLCIHSQTDVEKNAMAASKFAEYLESNGTLHFETFGPTKIQVPPRDVADRYVWTRFRNPEPCNLHGLYYRNEHWRYVGYDKPPVLKTDFSSRRRRRRLQREQRPQQPQQPLDGILPAFRSVVNLQQGGIGAKNHYTRAPAPETVTTCGRQRAGVISITEHLAVAFCDASTVRVFRTSAAAAARSGGRRSAAAAMIGRESLAVLSENDEDPASSSAKPERPAADRFVEEIIRDGESGNVVQLRTSGLIVNVTYAGDGGGNTTTALLSFWDSEEAYMYTQETGAHLLVNSIANDDDVVRQSWSLTRGESLYGGGQYVNGILDYAAAPIYWTQSNTEAVVPFVVSSRNYGILWDLYGETWLNPPDLDPSKNRLEFPIVVVPNRTVSGAFTPPQSGDYFFAIRCYNGVWKAWGDWSDTRLSLFVDERSNRTTRNNQIVTAVCEHVGLAAPPVVLTCRARNLQGGMRYRTVLDYKKWNGEFQKEPDVYYVSADEHQFTTIQSRSSDFIDYYFMVATTEEMDNSKGKGNDEIYQPQQHFTKMDSVVASYRRLTGPAPLYSKKAFGFWQCKERYHNQTELLEAAKQFRLYSIPIDNIVQDWHYWGDFGWGPQWDPTIYPRPKAMVDTLRDEFHLSLMVSVWSKFDQKTRFYRELRKKKYLINGTIWFDAWNPHARDTFYGYMNHALFSNGADAVWLDATEPEMNPQVNKTIFLGSGNRYRNTYSLMVTKSFYHGFTRDYPERRPFALTRSSFAGQQRYAAAIWSGDTTASFESLRRQIAMSINYQASGMPYWTCDIGGFFRPESQYFSDKYHLLLLRWFQFGVFIPLMRVHGAHSDTELWNYGAITQSLIVRSALDLRYRLLHYIYSGFRRVEQEGYTMGRAMVFDFPNDIRARQLADQFMFGESFLVAPIYTADSSRTFYLPRLPEKGSVWRNFYTGRVVRPGRHKAKHVDKSSMLLFVRSSVLVLAPKSQHADDTSGRGALEVRIYAGKDSSFTLFEDDGRDPDPSRPTTTIPFRWIEESYQLVVGRRRGQEFPGMWHSRVIRVVLVRPGIGTGVESGEADATVSYGGEEMTVDLRKANERVVDLPIAAEQRKFVKLDK